ncbi:hypothetical protein NDA16_003731 [Ustilago loliicola]|nr:hypothetical protein NDA16_003731 [Ustilago loliicola]
MEPVTMHPSGMPGKPAYDPSLFASRSRAGTVSIECIAAASDEGPSEPQMLQEGGEEKHPLASRQQETLTASKPKVQQQTTAAVPGFDEIPELASMKAAPAVRQALGSPAAQAEHRAELGDSPRAVQPAASTEDVSQETRPAATSEEVTQPEPRLSPNIGEHAVAYEMAGATSPASSSADAPGSDYEEFEGPDLVSHSALLPGLQKERSPTPSPETQRAAFKGIQSKNFTLAEMSAPPEETSAAQEMTVKLHIEASKSGEPEQTIMATDEQEQVAAEADQQESGAAEPAENRQSAVEAQEQPATEDDEQGPSATANKMQEQRAEPEPEDREEQEVAQLLPAAGEAEERKIEEPEEPAQHVETCSEDKDEEINQVTEDAFSHPQAPEATSMQHSAPDAPKSNQESLEQVIQQHHAGEDKDNQGWSLRISALLGEIEAQSAPAQREEARETQATHVENSEPPTVHQTESVPMEDQTIESSTPVNTLTRPAEETGASPKRQKLSEEAGATTEEAVSAETEATAAPLPPETQMALEASQPAKASKAKPQAKKSAPKSKPAPKPKPPPKPKAPPKPKKETKAKGKKASEQTEAAALVVEEQQPAPLPPLQTSTVPDQGTAADAEAADTKPKNARRAPARPRKKAAKLESGPEEAPQTPPPPQLQAHVLDPNLLGPVLPLAAVQPAEPETAPAEPAPKAKGKVAAKSRAPSKAKSKAKPAAEPPIPAEADIPIETVPKQKPAAKRTTAKKAKGPVAKLLPAQADDAVSELELEPTRQSSETIAMHTNQEDPQRGVAVLDEETARPSMQEGYRHPPSEQGDNSMTEEHQHFFRPPPPLPGEIGNSGEYTSSNIFTSMPPPLYPAQAYYLTRAQLVQQQNRGLSSLSNAASMLDSEMHWSESSAARPGSASSGYGGANEPTSPTTMTNTAGSVAGDAASDTTSLSQDQSQSLIELDPRIYPPGWQLPYFDLMDPDQLMTAMRERTVWTFWDCYLPLGCRDQDMVLQSNDGVAFPCAAWNPCLFSKLLKRVISNPSRGIRQIMQRGAEENRKILGHNPLPCVVIDENWHATNLLLSFLHPIPNMFLPDVATCRVVLDVGMKYGVDRAINMATQRLNQLDEEDRVKKGKGKARSTEEEIAADLAERAAEASRG